MTLRNLPVFPLFSDSVFSDRFNRIDRLFSQLTGDSPVSLTPPYDLKQTDDEHFSLTVSVPGWKQDELDIESTGGRLTISGKKTNESDYEENSSEGGSKGWLHRGISRTDFRLSYSVPEHLKVTEARLEDGLLSVALRLDIPESEKPRRIPIQHRTADLIEHDAV